MAAFQHSFYASTSKCHRAIECRSDLGVPAANFGRYGRLDNENNAVAECQAAEMPSFTGGVA